LVSILCGWAATSYKRKTSDIKAGGNLPVDFVKEGTQICSRINTY
jgi:hypothetical protein